MSSTIVCVTLNFVGKFKDRRPVGRVGVSGEIILKGISKKCNGRAWTEFIWLKIWIRGGLL
jgi:hypothetical protein